MPCEGCIDENFKENPKACRNPPQCPICIDGSEWKPPRYRPVCIDCNVMHGRPPSADIAVAITNNADMPDACRKSAANWLKWI